MIYKKMLLEKGETILLKMFYPGLSDKTNSREYAKLVDSKILKSFSYVCLPCNPGSPVLG